MPQRSEKVGADQVRHAGWQEGDALFPAARIHSVHHPDWKRRLQHGYPHVGERNRTCNKSASVGSIIIQSGLEVFTAVKHPSPALVRCDTA